MDSTKVIVPFVVSIAKDSVVTKFRYDTLRTRIIEKQGRATVIVEKHDSTIYVQASCDSVLIKSNQTVMVANKPVFQSGIPWWVYAVGAGLIALSLYLMYLIAIKTYNIKIEKKWA